MKFVFAIHKLTYSGAPKIMAWLANMMSRKGHEVHIITYFSNDNMQRLDKEIVVHALNFIQSKNRIIRNTTQMYLIISELHKLVKIIRPDVFVSFLDSVGYLYLLFGRLFTNSKLIISERVDPNLYKGVFSKAKFCLMRFAHGIVFQTDGARNFFSDNKKIFSNSVVIPNPVILSDNIRELRNLVPLCKNRKKEIVSVGRLSLKQKRQDVLLKAFKIFNNRLPDYKLILYGSGNDEKEICDLIENLELTESVLLAGRIENVEEKIINAKMFVLTSDYEGIPNALIEAMSIGVPCISTDCSPGGAMLLIKNGHNGFLVPRNDIEVLSSRMLELACNESLSDNFSRESVGLEKRFSEQDIAKQWEEYFYHIKKYYDSDNY